MQKNPDGHQKSAMISGARVQLLLRNLNPLYNSKNRKKTGLPPATVGRRGEKAAYGWTGDLFGGDERQKWSLDIQNNGAGSLKLWDGSRLSAADVVQEQAEQQVKDEDPLTDHFGGDMPQQIVQSFIEEFKAQNPGNLPSIESMGKHLADKQVKPIPKEFADRLGMLSEYLDIEKSQAVDYLEEMLELVGNNV